MSPTDQVDHDRVAFVRLAESVPCHHYRITIPNWPTFAAIMDALGDGYNNFDPHLITATFERLFHGCDSIEFGSEASAVLYLSLPFFEHQRRDQPSYPMGRKYTLDERRRQALLLIDWGQKNNAAEIDVQQEACAGQPNSVRNHPGDAPYRVRIWWD